MKRDAGCRGAPEAIAVQKKWQMLALAILNKNIAVAVTFGIYGLLINPLIETFATSYTVASLGIALVTLMMGVCSPLVGRLIDRWPVRRTLIAGCVISAVGFAAASQATSMPVFLVCFGVVAGIGVTAMGVLPAVKLAGSWFTDAPGKAIGALIPLSLAIAPPVFGYFLIDYGWRALLLGIALGFLALAPLELLVSDAPVGAAAKARKPAGAARRLSDRLDPALRNGPFWLLAIGSGLLLGAATALSTHIVSFGLEAGLSQPHATLLLSVFGLAAALGAFLFGWLADRLTPIVAISLNALGHVVLWLLLLTTTSFELLLLVTALFGMVGGGTYPVSVAVIATSFGSHRLGALAGYMALLVLPFNFGMSPLAGFLFDVTGRYTAAFMVLAGCAAAALVIMLTYRRRFDPAIHGID
jgi:MFS family permease